MSIGKNYTEGNKGSGLPFRSKVLQGIAAVSASAGLGASEATLQLVLSAIQNGQDYESKIVEDSTGATFIEVRIYEPDPGTWLPPVYYRAGDNTPYVLDGPLPAPQSPIVYINNGAVLAQIYAELLNMGLSLDQIDLNTDDVATATNQASLIALVTTIDAVLDSSLVQLQAINANTDQLEALSTDIKNLLTTIDADTGNIATSVAALELCCQATNTLLTTIDGVLDQIQTNTLNTVNGLTTANVTLVAVQNELIALNNTAGTLATELTLAGIKAQTDLLNFIATALEVNVTSSVLPTGAATETTLASARDFLNLLLAAFNAEDFASEVTLTKLLGPIGTDNVAHGASQQGVRILGTDGANDQQIAVTGDGEVKVQVTSPSAFPVTDNGGSLTVDNAVHDNLNANANLQVGDVDVSGANPVPVTLPAGVAQGMYRSRLTNTTTIVTAGATSMAFINVSDVAATFTDAGSNVTTIEPGEEFAFEAANGNTLGSVTVVTPVNCTVVWVAVY